MQITLPTLGWPEIAMIALSAFLLFGIWTVRTLGRRADNHTAALNTFSSVLCTATTGLDKTVLSVSDRAIKEVQALDATFSGISGEFTRLIEYFAHLENFKGIGDIGKALVKLDESINNTGAIPGEIVWDNVYVSPESLASIISAVRPTSLQILVYAVKESIDAVSIIKETCEANKREVVYAVMNNFSFSDAAKAAKARLKTSEQAMYSACETMMSRVQALLAALNASTDSKGVS